MTIRTRSDTGPARQPIRNRCVARVLRSPAHRLLPRSLALLTLTGARTGRSITFPVGTVRDTDGTLLVLVGRARHKTWWRNLVDGGRVAIHLAGRDHDGFGYVLDGQVDPAHTAGALRVYLQGNPRAVRVLGIGRIGSAGVTPGQLAAAAPQAVLVRIHLLPATESGSDETAARASLSRWVAACVAGEAAGIGVAAAVFALLNATVGEPQTGLARALTWTLLVAAGALEGLALGGLQWLVLRRQLPSLPARRWVGATVVLAATGWGIGMLPSTLASAASTADSAGPQLPSWLGAVLLVAGGLVAGATVGAVQAWAARGYATGRAGWVVANAIGWTLALGWIFALAGLPAPDWPAWAIALDGFVAGVGSGTIVGLVTGAWLNRLRPATLPSAAHGPGAT